MLIVVVGTISEGEGEGLEPGATGLSDEENVVVRGGRVEVVLEGEDAGGHGLQKLEVLIAADGNSPTTVGREGGD